MFLNFSPVFSILRQGLTNLPVDVKKSMSNRRMSIDLCKQSIASCLVHPSWSRWKSLEQVEGDQS